MECVFMSRFDWILFDMDDTLVDFVHSARYAFSTMLAQLEIPEAEPYFPLYQQCNHEAWAAFEEGKIDTATLRRQRFAQFQERAQLLIRHDPGEMNRLFLNALVHHSKPIDGAIDLLNFLFGKTKMGIVTNGLREVQRPRIRHVGMEHFFEVVVVSDEIGLAKPDPKFFSHAYEAMGRPDKNRVLVVGDSLISDIQGAKNFDFAACWFNPLGKPNPNGWRPDFEIQSLDEVRGIGRRKA